MLLWALGGDVENSDEARLSTGERLYAVSAL
jgi:hypothetical protein